MDDSIVEDIKKALSRLDRELPTPSQKRQALDCVKKVIENPPAKVAPPKKSVGRPASEIRKIFNESKKEVVGKRGPQSVQIAVDLLDKRIKWIEEKLGESVSYEQIKLYFKPELARIKTGKEKEGLSETDPIPKPKPEPKPETKPEPKKKRGRPITTGKSLQRAKQKEKEREKEKEWEEQGQMREEDPQPKISWYENLDKTKEKAEKAKAEAEKAKVKAEKEAKAKPKRDEAQKGLAKIAKKAQEQLKKAEKEEKKAKVKAEKEAEKAKEKAEKAKAEAEQAKAEAEQAKAEAEQAKKEAKKKPEEEKKNFKSTYTNTIPWDVVKSIGLSKQIPEEWRKGIVKDKNGLVSEIEDVKQTNEGFVRTKFVFTLEKKNGDKKEFEIEIQYRPYGKIADIINDELIYDITDEEEEQEEIEEIEDEEEFLVRADEQPNPYAKMAVKESTAHKGDKKYFRDKIKASNGLIEEYLTYEELNEYPRIYKDEIEAADTLPFIADFVMFPIYKKKKKGSGKMVGSGLSQSIEKNIYTNSIMNTQERPDGLVKKVKKVVVKPTPVVIVNGFKKREFGTALGNKETQEMPINVPDVSIVPKLKNNGKTGLAPLQSKPRYEGAGALRNRGFHTQNTKEYIESRYM